MFRVVVYWFFCLDGCVLVCGVWDVRLLGGLLLVFLCLRLCGFVRLL